ncbi:ACP S-malonyltransferase [Treponema brennaborense]|uniref:Malonyl CoA-acyl carrier protein transacylase n=1 Tax=Treponema brennaborense (strain DSM 12168 / CIP 105900 / DD5/3) TaxID=906968 RepID=F4LQB6_TREBD|nr:ACP S-malonyltransferase [Treponema brennaborense]AEE16137.1 (Acyl-carrier-protein) S-malonyltransferase [Treponema brennaborense DSM 12168]
MVKKYAFLFPGQGAQAQGMMKDVCEAFPAARKCVDAISEIAGEDITKLLWDTEASVLSRSDRSQLAITAASLAVFSALKSKGIEPSVCAGFSLGEFPALCASGVLSFDDTIRVVKKRGEIMQKVCEAIAARNAGNAPGMAAIIGLPPEKVLEIAKASGEVYGANMNSARQTVVSGTAAGLTKAEELCKEAGARRFVRLAVAGPFHCPLMQEAADEFEKAIAAVTFKDPDVPLLSNVSGALAVSGAEIKKSAVLHLTHPVLWTSEEAVLGKMITGETDGGNAEWALLEAGPGKVLSGLWRDTEFGEKWAAVPVNTADAINAL